MRYSNTNIASFAVFLSTILVATGCDRFQPAPAPVPVAAPTVAVVPAPSAAPAPANGTAPTPAPAAAKGEPGLDVQAHVKQAFSYISNAKNAREAYIREESIENAVKEFSLAIQKDPGYAEAYSNRAAAYMLQRKFNKAEEDLRKAKELSPNSPSVRYNYASLHSLRGNIDLALDEIDAALGKGFSDYDALRRDPDLENLRRS
ncbi:MAG TPA: tetratricopeptide repeat protein, partial [Burkholderiaceae bacterium]|nr:tetratricopeptide repeat protein [Burkholderiaceae bacterium]